MLLHLNKYVKSHKLLVITSIVLFIIPFFWFPFGYIDIGGDSSRLYFYDPLSFLHNFVLNPFLPDSLGIKSSGVHMFPFVILLFFLKSIFITSWFVNNFFNSISIVIPFLTIYEIVSIHIQDIVKKFNQEKSNSYYAAILAGLFFILIPISSQSGWDLPLIIHSQRFIYPMIFLLLLKYIRSSEPKYLLISLFLTFIFAHNFSWVSIPNMIGFFLITSLYLLAYSVFIFKKKFSTKPLFVSIILFFLLHAFHLFPLVGNIFSKNSDVSNQLMQGIVYEDTIKYIDSIADYTEKGYHFFGLTPFASFSIFHILLFIFPLLILYLLFNNNERRILLPVSFFLLTYFLITAKITNIGFTLYKQLFHIPGMVSFRNFYGRWFDIYLLFYAIIVGLGLFYLLRRLSNSLRSIVIISVLIILIINGIPFLTGQISNRILTQDTGVIVKSRVNVDSDFEKLLNWYRKENLPERNISFPITDYTYQIIAGSHDDGAYFGPSMIAYLTGKNDLGSVFPLRPFAKVLFEKIKSGDYKTFANIFPLLGVNTVFYNSDKYIYEVFATFPYFESKLYMPETQKGYTDLLHNLPLTKIRDFSNKYHLFKVNEPYVLPIFYAADNIVFYKQEIKSTFDESNYNNAKFVLEHFCCNEDKPIKKAFLDKKNVIGDISQPDITYKRISFDKFKVNVKNASKPYLLVFSQAFHPGWKVFLSSGKTKTFDKSVSIAGDRHYLANVYANAWYIIPSDARGKSNYTLTLELSDQSLLLIGFFISGIGLILTIIWNIKIKWRK